MNRFEPAKVQGEGSWITDGLGGVLRWPVRRDAGQAASYHVGPPQRLAALHSTTAAAQNDKMLLGRQGDRVFVLDHERPGHRLELGPQEDIRPARLGRTTRQHDAVCHSPRRAGQRP